MLIHHVDIHVRTMDGPRRIFDALMTALEFPRISTDAESTTYYPAHATQPFIGLMLDEDHVPGSMRVAFAATSKEHVDRLAKLVTDNGACATEGPQYWTEYSPDYYAFFFEDDNGNKYEIVHR